MKLVIRTQYRENYNWGDIHAPFFKFKNGNVYELHKLDMRSTNTKQLLDQLRPLLEDDEDVDCYIFSVQWEDESVETCDPWESPIILNYVPNTKEWLFYEEVKDTLPFDEDNSLFKVVGIRTWTQKNSLKRYDYRYEPYNFLNIS